MSFRTVLGNAAFRKLWIAQVVSGFGDRVHEIALLFIVFERTGDPLLVAATAAASTIPELVLSVPAGAVADWFDRKRIMVGSAVVRGCSVLAIPPLADAGLLVPAVLGVAVVAGAAESFASPARNAMVPNVVAESQLDAANGLSRMTGSLLRFLYAAGGALIALVGVEGAFYVDAATFFAAAAVLATLPASVGRGPGRTEEPAFDAGELVADARGGIAYVIGSPILASLVVLSGLTAFAMAPLGVVIPFYSETVLGGTATFGHSTAIEFGTLYASIYVGVFAGGIGVNALEGVFSSHRGAGIIVGVLSIGLVLIALGGLNAEIGTRLLWPALLFAALGVAVAVVGVGRNVALATVV
ncbi:MAG: MFS transporter, partial [Halobacteriales archaeon]